MDPMDKSACPWYTEPTMPCHSTVSLVPLLPTILSVKFSSETETITDSKLQQCFATKALNDCGFKSGVRCNLQGEK